MRTDAELIEEFITQDILISREYPDIRFLSWRKVDLVCFPLDWDSLEEPGIHA